MNAWNVLQLGNKPQLRKPILIEGLPGIGNVGKVAIDFLIDELKARKLYEITSHSFPSSVFVNEDNLVELPKIEIYYKKLRNSPQDLLLLAGDIQPIDETSSYEFSGKMLDMLEEFKGTEVLTLGGIGLADIPKKPKVYCTGTTKSILRKYRKFSNVEQSLYGVVGPIIGVSGLLLGLAKQRDIEAACLLAETYSHPMYLGVKGSREILKVISQRLRLNLKLSRLDKEIKETEKELSNKELPNPQLMLKKPKKFKETDYIG